MHTNLEAPTKRRPRGARQQATRPGEERYEASYTLFLLLVLLIPGKNIYASYALTTFAIFLFAARQRPTKNGYFKAVLAFMAFITAASGVRWFLLGELNLRDYAEIFRFMPVAVAFAFMRRWRGLRLENFIDAACLYLAVDGFVSYLQFVETDALGVRGLAQSYYNYERHYRVSLMGTGRVLGLSPGPGQHGSILLVLVVTVLLGVFKTTSWRRMACVVGCFLGIVIAIFTQSQTSFVAISGAVSLMIFLHLAGGSGRNRIMAGAIAALCLFVGANLLFRYAADLGYLLTLFEYGLERNSYQAREMKWARLSGNAADFPYLMPIGWGKGFFGEDSGAMDNEYLYVALVYGIPVLLFYLFVLARFIIATGAELVRGKEKGDLNTLLFYMFSGGLIVAWPTSFLLQVNVMFLVSMVLAARWWERKEAKAS